jgi:hypothetical protein
MNLNEYNKINRDSYFWINHSWRFIGILITSLFLIHGGSLAALLAAFSNTIIQNGLSEIGGKLVTSIMYFGLGIMATLTSCLMFALHGGTYYFLRIIFVYHENDEEESERHEFPNKKWEDFIFGTLLSLALGNLFVAVALFPLAFFVGAAGLQSLPPRALSAPQAHSTEEQRPLEDIDVGSLHPLDEGPVGQEPIVDPVDLEPIMDDCGPVIQATGGSEPP